MSIIDKITLRGNSGDFLLDSLNEEQKQAVENTEGAVLVLAGAGTGKTRILTCRTAYILKKNLALAHQVMVVTFTNKAAAEIRQRCYKLLGSDYASYNMPYMGTFHSICAKILRRHSELVGLKSNFTIINTDDAIKQCAQVIDLLKIDKKLYPPRRLAYLIDRWKNHGWYYENLPQQENQEFAQSMGIAAYKLYQQRLKELNAADFGDLILECFRLFQENAEILKRYRKNIRYVMVDEYQDTNVIQYMWLRLLVGNEKEKPPNICCVGDDDQSIYSWRGVEVGNILAFKDHFANAEIIRLNKNYRSDGHIVAVASHLVRHNKFRHKKKLLSVSGMGEKVTITGFWEGKEEARDIARNIESYITKGISPDKIAILVRISAQMREIEDKLFMLNIDYRIIGGIKFYNRAEIRDATAYLKVIANPHFDLAFERIINVPARGIGTKTIKNIRCYAQNKKISLYDAACQIITTDELSARARNSARLLLSDFDRWRRQAKDIPLNQLCEIVLEESGYIDKIKSEDDIKTETKIENLQELVRAMSNYQNLEAFLEHISLMLDEDQTNSTQKVNLMTLHSAKGLEFEVVFIPGFEQGLFPHQKCLNEEGSRGIEEERRLAYVGITRASKFLNISFAKNRRIYNNWQHNEPSEFLNELPYENVQIEQLSQEQEEQKEMEIYYNSGYNSNFTQNRNRYHLPKQKWWLGQRIMHKRFGYGNIISLDGQRLEVEFEKCGCKIVLEDFVVNTEH